MYIHLVYYYVTYVGKEKHSRDFIIDFQKNLLLLLINIAPFNRKFFWVVACRNLLSELLIWLFWPELIFTEILRCGQANC